MTNPELIILDFDRTLFDVDAYWGYFLDAVERCLSVERTVIESDYNRERTHDEVFDPFPVISQALGQDQLSEDQLTVIQDELIARAKKFIVNGAKNFLKRAEQVAWVEIITTGNVRYQQFKFELVADYLETNLSSSNLICVSESKVDTIVDIAREASASLRHTLYIDDRAGHVIAADHLQKQGLTLVWFNSPAAKKGRNEDPPNTGLKVDRLSDIIFTKEHI